MKFVKVQVIANEDFVDDVFQQIVTTNSIYDAETWNFKMTYSIDDSMNPAVDDLVIVPVCRKATRLTEFQVAKIVEVLPDDTNAEDFDFTIKEVTAKLELANSITSARKAAQDKARKAELKAKMDKRAQELSEEEHYKSLAANDPELQKMFDEWQSIK